MALDVTEIQNRIAALADVTSTAPTQGGNDWNLRLKYLNMAQAEWEQLYDWQTLYTEFNTRTSTSSGNTSITMPSNFRKLASFPRFSYDGTNSADYAEIRPQERSRRLSTDRYFYLLHNASTSVMVVNTGTTGGQFASGASISITYYRTAGSLVSGSDSSPIPDPNYLVQRATSMLWESTGDDRFPQAKAKAEQILQRLLQRENVFSEAANDESKVRTVDETRYSYRIGRD
jgi:hypothetical protein